MFSKSTLIRRQIETTMRDLDADEVAEQLWQTHGVGTLVGTSPFSTCGHSDSVTDATSEPVDGQRL